VECLLRDAYCEVGLDWAQRHAHTDGVSPHTFLNEADALAFLSASGAPPR
jgi:hypothetical protein